MRHLIALFSLFLIFNMASAVMLPQIPSLDRGSTYEGISGTPVIWDTQRLKISPDSGLIDNGDGTATLDLPQAISEDALLLVQPTPAQTVTGGFTITGTLTADGLTVGTNENLTFGTETLTFDAITSLDFEFSDDVNVTDPDPKYGLTDSNGDDFELWADANRVYLADVTNSRQLFMSDGNLGGAWFLYEANAEIAGLVRHTALKHFTATFDPSGWYDQDATNHNVPLFTVGDDAPQGIIIDEWQCTYSTGNPTTELAAKLYYASDWAWTGETEIDDISTTAGSSSEDTDANINSGNAITNGKKIYIGFTADPTDANVAVILEIWFHLAN